MRVAYLRYTLITDGSSDRVLLPILDWLFRTHSAVPFRGQWAGAVLPGKLAGRVRRAVELYPCDILFVHRDAEREQHSARAQEIALAANDIAVRCIAVVPVRMTEAWLLSDEQAIRSASGNPNGRMPLALPDPKRVEDIPDPKHVLFELLKTASGLTGRRLAKLDCHRARNLVGVRTDDFASLRRLLAFRRLEASIESALAEMHEESGT